jgi:hypothetical protein
MTAQGLPDEQAWADVGALPEEQRQSAMQKRYTELLPLSEDERRSRMLAMAKGENSLSDDKLRAFTKSRLLTWLAMDMDSAKKVAASYAAVMQQMPGPVAMRWIALMQTMAREFSSDQVLKLRALLPTVFGTMPVVAATIKAALTAAPPETQEPSGKKGGFWPFGKKR